MEEQVSDDRIDLLKRINALQEENKVLHKALDKACVKLEHNSSLKEEPWDKISKENWKLILMEERKVKKVFISQPMKGKTNEEIKRDRELIIKDIEDMMEGDPFEIMDTVFEDFDGATPLKFLAKSLMVLADADAVYFADGWRETRGCRIENRCAVAYGLNIIKDQESVAKTKQEIMKELLDRYQQLESLNGCKSARTVLEGYIRKLELKLKDMLQGGSNYARQKKS